MCATHENGKFGCRHCCAKFGRKRVRTDTDSNAPNPHDQSLSGCDDDEVEDVGLALMRKIQEGQRALNRKARAEENERYFAGRDADDALYHAELAITRLQGEVALAKAKRAAALRDRDTAEKEADNWLQRLWCSELDLRAAYIKCKDARAALKE